MAGSRKGVLIEEYSGQPVQIYKSALTKPTKISRKNDFTLWLKAQSFFVTVFLPQGYPHTVTSDYVEYQIWDTLQAFASSLTGALSTAAILKGVGVGNKVIYNSVMRVPMEEICIPHFCV